MIKPIFYYSVMTDNVGDVAIRNSIINSIKKRLDVPICLLDVKHHELTEERIVKQVNKEVSALVIAGSGLYSNANTSSGWCFPCKTELFKKIKVPIILLGLGLNKNLQGNFYTPKSSLNQSADKQHSIKLINELAKISTVRDFRTTQFLNELGITKHELMLDPACFLEVVPQKKENLVAINLAQHAPILGRYDGTKQIRNKNLVVFAKLGNYLRKKGYNLIFIAHDPLEQSLINDLKVRFPELQYINTCEIDKVLQTYSKCVFSIGMKMHSNIMSFAAGTPFVSLYYDQKSIEFLKMLELNVNDYGLSVFDYNVIHLRKLVDKMLLNYVNLTTYLSAVKTKEQQKFDNLIDRVCEIIKNATL